MAAQEQPAKLLHIMTVSESLGFVAGQVGYMAARGFDVTAMSSPGEALDRFRLSEQVATFPVEMARRISPAADMRALWHVYNDVRSLSPHIVHAHTPKAGLLGMIAAWRASVPVRIYHIHGLPLLTATGRHRMILRRTERTACRLATRVLCVSPSVRDVVLKEGLCPPGKISVLGAGSINGVEAQHRFSPDRFDAEDRGSTRADLGIPKDAAVIGFVGRIVRDKGLIELSKAWRSLRDAYPLLHMLVIGPFEFGDPVPPEVESALRSDSRIHLVGLDWDTPPLYSAMDLVVLPSYREGFPVVPLEAAAMGLPVVATRVPGCVDAVVDGVTGILTPPRDAAALAGAIRFYLDSPLARKQHGAAGRQRVLRDFRPEAVWEAMHQEYRRLLDAAGFGGGAWH